MRTVAFILVLFVGTGSAFANTIDRTKPIREVFDIRYHDGKDRRVLDVFTPPAVRKDAKLPVVFFVHGGTWMIGDKNFYGINRNVGRFLAHEGFVAVLPNYRLSPHVRHPAHVEDVAEAFAWMVKNVARYGGDAERIILMGHSAGGHLVSLLMTDESYLKKAGLHLDAQVRKSIRAVVALSGVYRIPGSEEFGKMAQEIVEHMVGDTSSYTRRLAATALMNVSGIVNPFVHVFGASRDIQQKASPISHVHKGLPPFFLLYAQAEIPGLVEMATDFARELKEQGATVQIRKVPDCDHRTIVRSMHKENDDSKAVLAFIRTTLAKSR